MSMIGHLRAVTTTELRTLQKDPASVRELLHGTITASSGKVEAALLRVSEIARQAMAAGTSKKSEKLREQILAEFESAGVTAYSDGGDQDGLTLEKSWHSLHYLLTGTAGKTDSVLGKAILGGKEIGPDMGYGPARYLEATEVKKVAKALTKVSSKELARRFNLKAMVKAKVYACRDEGELKSAQNYFTQVVRYYGEAAERGDAMLLYLD